MENFEEEYEFEETFIEDEFEPVEEGYELEKEEVDEKRFDILSNLSKGKKKKNMYFDEELVKHLILDVYQPSLIYGIDEKGKRVCVDRTKADKEVEKEIMANLLLIANAIINKYSYWRFDSVDDLQSECLKAMWYYLPNFQETKGTAFNLFSILCKRHLLNFTLKNQKHRTTADIDIQPNTQAKDDLNYNLFFEDLEKTFLDIIDRNFVKEQRKKYIELTSILMEYLVKNKKIVGKNDLIASFREYGYKSSDYKKFIEDMSKYKSLFYELS